MKSDLNDLKELVLKLIHNDGHLDATDSNSELIKKVFSKDDDLGMSGSVLRLPASQKAEDNGSSHTLEVEESLSLQEREKELIKKALEKHKNKRKYAAKELGISERTLYRKIKEYSLK